MKTTIIRNLIALIGFFSCCSVFMSCTDTDNIDVSYDTQLSIDLLDITNSFTYQLNNGELNNLPDNQKIEVILCVYEVNTGKIVSIDKKFALSYNNTLSFNLNISTLGNYKALVITRIVSDDGFAYWEVSYDDNIENLRILPSTTNSDFGLSQLLGMGCVEIEPSISTTIPLKPAGGLIIPRIICNEDLTLNYSSLKLTIPKFCGEYRLDKNGNFSYRNIKDVESCVLEIEPHEFYRPSYYSYHSLYTYKFVPLGCELKLELNLFSHNSDYNLIDELFDFRDFEVSPGKEFVFRVETEKGFYSTAFGEATNKRYQEECENKNHLLGSYSNEYGKNLKCVDTQIERIHGVLYK